MAYLEYLKWAAINLISDMAYSHDEDYFTNNPNVRLGNKADAMIITELVNTAFLKDSFFKNREYYTRVKEDGSTVKDILKNSSSRFLLYVESDSKKILGCIKIELDEFDSKSDQNALDNPCQNKISQYQASFGMLSVPERNGKRGIGSSLLKAMEEYIMTRAKQCGLNSAHVCMPLISLRSDLFEFYEKRGYTYWKETELEERANPMVLKEYEGKITFKWYRKFLKE